MGIFSSSLNGSLKLQHENFVQISNETGFTFHQIERFWSRFTHLDKQHKGYLTKDDLFRIPELAINPLADRIVNAFFNPRSNIVKNKDTLKLIDGAKEEVVNFCDFVKVLAHFQPVKAESKNCINSKHQKLNFAFQMYDLDGDGKISMEELLAVLKMMIGENMSEDQLLSIADRTLRKAKCENLITFEEFCEVLDNSRVEKKLTIKFLD